MSEIEKMYENAEINPLCQIPDMYCGIKNVYEDFTAEKQIKIEDVLLQNKRNYNKWIEYNINVYGEWVIRFVKTNKFAPYVAVEKTRAEALANLVNNLWQDLTKEEKQQVKGILE